MGHQPKVSVGMPVYNGEKFVAEAIESILGQSLGALELIIYDNASTDGTEEICREFAKADTRVRYARNARNLGADPNYNLCLHAAAAPYFKWAAHDDRLAPRYLEACVAALEAEPDAVLCHSQVRIIDALGRTIGDFDEEYATAGAGRPRPSQRFAPIVLQSRLCSEIFGVIRTEWLRRTGLHRGFYNSDRVLLAELALLGRFLTIDEPWFENRDHDLRYVRSARLTNQRAWHDTARAHRMVLPHLEMWRALVQMVGRHVGDRRERLRCYGALLGWWGVNWNLLRIAADPICAINPNLIARFERLKHRLVGASAHNAVNFRNIPRQRP
ncbi:MAG: glycosyltransferase family 2 protein [Alphaproteobacteria bacterium]|nr:glycosyltransferase family 2 protein [Alphaproteobacteria bacterium]